MEYAMNLRNLKSGRLSRTIEKAWSMDMSSLCSCLIFSVWNIQIITVLAIALAHKNKLDNVRVLPLTRSENLPLQGYFRMPRRPLWPVLEGLDGHLYQRVHSCKKKQSSEKANEKQKKYNKFPDSLYHKNRTETFYIHVTFTRTWVIRQTQVRYEKLRNHTNCWQDTCKSGTSDTNISWRQD